MAGTPGDGYVSQKLTELGKAELLLSNNCSTIELCCHSYRPHLSPVLGLLWAGNHAKSGEVERVGGESKLEEPEELNKSRSRSHLGVP